VTRSNGGAGEIWPEDWLPDGTLLGNGLSRHNKIISGWLGFDCAKCNGTGEDFSDANAPLVRCGHCGGTGEAYGPILMVEE
jgi:hypothetical protein